VGVGFAVFTLYLCLPLKEALFIFLRTLYLCNKHVFPIETTIRKGGYPDKKPYHPYVFRNP
jgi:hypothetical protein